MARQNLWDLTVDHDHMDCSVGIEDEGPLGDLARVAQTAQDLGRILVLYYSRDDGVLHVRSLADEVGR